MEYVKVGKWVHDKDTKNPKTLYCWSLGAGMRIQGNFDSIEQLASSVRDYNRNHRNQLYLGEVGPINSKSVTPAINPLDEGELTILRKKLQSPGP